MVESPQDHVIPERLVVPGAGPSVLFPMLEAVEVVKSIRGLNQGHVRFIEVTGDPGKKIHPRDPVGVEQRDQLARGVAQSVIQIAGFGVGVRVS